MRLIKITQQKNQCLTVAVILVVLSGCIEKTITVGPEVFHIPRLVNSQFKDSVQSYRFEANYISAVHPRFAGKYKFSDCVDINPETRDTIKKEELWREYRFIRTGDSIDVNGFEIYVDYATDIQFMEYPNFYNKHFDYFPVYFVNSTSTDKMFLGKDSHVFGTQEAYDNNKWGWKKIEKTGWDFCGNGSWGLVVHPQEFVLVLMRKYQGDIETDMRVRFEIGESIYVSKPFKGVINPLQFRDKDSQN